MGYRERGTPQQPKALTSGSCCCDTRILMPSRRAPQQNQRMGTATATWSLLRMKALAAYQHCQPRFPGQGEATWNFRKGNSCQRWAEEVRATSFSFRKTMTPRVPTAPVGPQWLDHAERVRPTCTRDTLQQHWRSEWPPTGKTLRYDGPFVRNRAACVHMGWRKAFWHPPCFHGRGRSPT